jgi:hypothetical protein
MSSKPTKAKDVMCIPRRMHRSPAYRKLTATSIFILMEFMYRRKVAKTGRKGGYEITNNGELIFTYAEAEKKHKIPRSTFCRSISQLVELGFIEIPHPGGGMLKDCSKYGTSDRWRDYGKEGFKKKSRQKDTRKLGITKENWMERVGSKRKLKSKAGITGDTKSSITNDTNNQQMPGTPSIVHATLKTDPNYYIQKGLEVLEAMSPSRYQKRYYSIDCHSTMN